MLRIYFLQQWLNLSDSGVEEALYDWAVLRQFAGIDLGGGRYPTRPRCASSVSAGGTQADGWIIVGGLQLKCLGAGIRLGTVWSPATDDSLRWRLWRSKDTSTACLRNSQGESSRA